MDLCHLRGWLLPSAWLTSVIAPASDCLKSLPKKGSLTTQACCRDLMQSIAMRAGREEAAKADRYPGVR